jgi:hypothetical protein
MRHILIYLYRMGREAFDHVLDIIKDDPIFVSTGKKPQRSAKHQLMVFLLRVGGRLAQESANVGSVSEGSVYQYCSWVSKALRCRCADFIAWPGEQRRQYIKEECAEHGFPGCVGLGDATFFAFRQKPRGSTGWTYWCRKKFYSVSFFCTPHIYI